MTYQPELIGGHGALDLLNTISWRLDPSRTIDRIATPEALATWCAAVGFADLPSGGGEGAAPESAGAEAAGGLLERVAAVREVVYGAVLPVARGMEAADLGELQRLLAGAIERATPSGVRPLDWRGAGLVDELVLAAGRLVEREDLGRLRECQDSGCGWLFLDRSKNGSRRWCSSGDCGNRARAKRHYQRLHPGTGSPS
ncbi:CGNR zinc finger domain-containing protein [Kribbella sp. NPDC051718]|uniref:CGNR zinc finger domain-containing protein n=1 Tax=Kribbella sp. NPDC051718 TaxID=3155168 RepID=UPI00342B78E0